MTPWKPPRWVFSVLNPIVRTLLRSPMHRILSRRVMLLSYRGRTSGATYTTPVLYFPLDEASVIAFSSTGWWRSLRDERPVRVLVRGRWREATPAVEASPERRGEAIRELVRRFGPAATRPLFLGLPTDRPPTDEELRRVAATTAVVTFRIPADGA